MNIKNVRITGMFFAATLVFWAIGFVPVMAQDILSKAINDPSVAWSVYGSGVKAELVKDSAVSGGTAERIRVSDKGEHPWDSGASTLSVKPVATGDVLLLAFWARAQDMPAGADGADITAVIQENTAPYTALGSGTPLHIGPQWKLYYTSGIAAKAYPAKAVSAALQLATAKQVIDFGPIFLLNFGAGYDLSKLPHN